MLIFKRGNIFTILILIPELVFCRNPHRFIFHEDSKTKADRLIADQPVLFIENEGQMTGTDHKPVPFILFKADFSNLSVCITEYGLTYIFFEQKNKKNGFSSAENSGSIEADESQMAWERVDLFLENANIKKENVIKEYPSKTEFNYYLAHCPKGITKVKQFKKITIKDVYPGIDWVFYNSEKQGFKYDFILRPGADPHKIQLLYKSLERPVLGEEGNLVLRTGKGILTEHAPYSYCRETEKKVDCNFKLESKKVREHFESRLSFVFDKRFDKQQTLVIDPQLVWSTFFGGYNNDGPRSISVDSNGNLYVAGYSCSYDFPTVFSGGYYQGFAGSIADAMILKFNDSGILMWSTFYGGTAVELIYSMSIDSSNNIFVAGWTTSTDFPTMNTGTFYQPANAGGPKDGFISKFNASGALMWATYYGGTGEEEIMALANDVAGNLFVAGFTNSYNFPLQNSGNFFQGNLNGLSDGFLLTFDNTGNRLQATYVGGSGNDSLFAVKSDAIGNVFIAGVTGSTDFPVFINGGFSQANRAGNTDVFITRFNNVLSPTWSTYYGGSQNERNPYLDISQNGDLILICSTDSPNFPVQSGSVYFKNSLSGFADICLAKFDNFGNRIWSTYFGGNGNESLLGSEKLVFTPCGDFYFNFEVITPFGSLAVPCDGGFVDNTQVTWESVVVHFSNAGGVNWTSYLGGDGFDGISPIAFDKNGFLYLSGEWANCWHSSSYPLVDPGNGAYFDSTANGLDDAYLAKFAVNNNIPESFKYKNPICRSLSYCPPVLPPAFPGGGTYSWAGNGGTLNINSITGAINPSKSSAGNYIVIYTPGLCGCVTFAPISTTIEIIDVPNVSVNNASICLGGSCVIEATVEPGVVSHTWIPQASDSYSIKVNPTVNTIYSISVTFTNGCVRGAWVDVIVHLPPPVSASNPTFCPGDTIVLAAEYYPSITSYSWIPFGSNAASVSIHPLANVIYTLGVRDEIGCENFMVKTLTVTPFPTVTVSNVTICPRGFATITPSVSPLSSSLKWYPTGQTAMSLQVSPGTTSEYKIVANNKGCIDSTSVTVFVTRDFHPDFIIDKTTGFAPFRVHLNNSSPRIFGNDTIEFLWSFGNGTIFTTKGFTDAEATYTAAGNYTITLASMTELCLDTAYRVIHVELPSSIEIPNIFSPNGDGSNDVFFLKTAGLKTIEALIYDRWGNKVYEVSSTSGNIDWDGKNLQKQDCAAGVYFYVITAEGKDGQNYKNKGNVTLVR